MSRERATRKDNRQGVIYERSRQTRNPVTRPRDDPRGGHFHDGRVRRGGGASGATLQASKTLDICIQADGSWKYTGEVSVWNTGAADATGLNITDCLQYKAASKSGQPTDKACLFNLQGSTTTIPGYSREVNAFTFSYDFTSYPYTTPLDLSGTIRNSAQVNITNHSGGNVTGPNPKATWTGGTPPACQRECGCTYTQGYWDDKPGVVWPAPYDRGALFFNSGLTWQRGCPGSC